MPLLVTPDAKYAASYIEALTEGLDQQSAEAENIALARSDFKTYLKNRNDMSRPVTLPDGTQVPRLPQIDLWLVEGDMFLGRASIRPELNDTLRLRGGHIGYAVRATQRRKGYGRLILKLALSYLYVTFGHTRALVTCGDDNIGSAKIIESCGGVLEDKVAFPGLIILERRYWIERENNV